MVIENGKLSAFGTHQALISQEGLYKRVWDIQSAIEEAEAS
jgi:ATP-binding cassette subfamily B protein